MSALRFFVRAVATVVLVAVGVPLALFACAVMFLAAPPKD